MFDHSGIVFRNNFDNFPTAIVKLRTNFVPITANIMMTKVPIIFPKKRFGGNAIFENVFSLKSAPKNSQKWGVREVCGVGGWGGGRGLGF